jgi:hypothetical protein
VFFSMTPLVSWASPKPVLAPLSGANVVKRNLDRRR